MMTFSKDASQVTMGAIQRGERHFEPGVLASANRGLLYVDEVNLLDDGLVDVVLDSGAWVLLGGANSM
jgi:Mg-chelatase subunit ChlI